jgi:hypothetical protein
MEPTTTPNNGSLESAGNAIAGLLSPSEDKQPVAEQPEQTPPEKEVSEQAPAAPEESESEQAAETEEQDDTPPPPRTFKVKVNGQEVEVTEDEVLKGYSRTEDYTRKTQQLAEARKAFEEQEVAAVRAERHQYATYLEQLKTSIEASTAEPDWAKLRTEVSPEVFAAELLDWQQTQKRLTIVREEQAKVKAQQDADAHAGFTRYVQDQQAKLEDALPALKVPETAKVLKASLNEYAKSIGFTEDDLGKVTDHRLVVLLHKAMEADKAKAKAPVIENKIEKALAASEPGSRTTPQKVDKLGAAQERARKTGRAEDAGAAIALMLQQKAS